MADSARLGKPGRVLLVSYHFPPIQGSTGVSRAVAQSKYLKELGWDVKVLTVHPRAYQRTDDKNLQLIPAEVGVVRSSAWDTQRHFSVFGRYPILFALPDRWQSWVVTGLLSARRLMRSWKPDVVLSTYPIASAQFLGYFIHRLFGVPWVAELRDPMAQDGYPTHKLEHMAFRWIERKIFTHASMVVVTTQGCQKFYAARFPEAESKIKVITNGYDQDLLDSVRAEKSTTPDPQVFLHSGLLYASERNPTELFQALSELKQEGSLSASIVVFRFRASGDEARYLEQIKQLGIDDIVEFADPVPYRDAISEYYQVDGLLVLQGDNCDDQIPAKVYEYLYTGRKILGLASPQGDTGSFLSAVGVSCVAALEDKEGIKVAILRFLQEDERSMQSPRTRTEVEKYSRRSLTAKLSQALTDLVGE